VLETVVAGHNVLEQNIDGSYSVPRLAPGDWIRLRVESDQPELATSASGAELPRCTSGATSCVEPNIQPSEGSRGWFEDIVVKLPSRTFFPRPFPLQVRYADASIRQAPLVVDLNGQPPFATAGHVFESGDNSKDSGNPFRVCQYAKTAIVARDVTVAGWLVATPERNWPGTATGPHESEDFHYDLVPDVNFFARNYGSLASLLKPVAGAVIPGHPTPCNPLITWPQLPLLVNGAFDPNAILLPGAFGPTAHATGSVLGVELNSWHIPARGVQPDGWVRDPNQKDFSNDAWPFNPVEPGVGSAPRRPLAANDYVIMSGTLWEDSYHPGIDSPWNKCWNGHFTGHGGWLEIHPVDSMRAVDPPSVRRTPHMATACDPSEPTFNDYFFPDTPATNTSVLKWRRVDDPRFSAGGATISENMDPTCPTALHVHVTVPPKGYWKAIYYVWWAPSSQPQRRAPGCSRPGQTQQEKTIRRLGRVPVPLARRDEADR
jgi:hypothetical protein